MKINGFIIGIILTKNCLCEILNLTSDQSMTYINNNLVVYNPSMTSQDQSLISYPWKSKDFFDLQNNQDNKNYTEIKRDFIDSYDYKFFNPSGELSSRQSTYMLGSIKLKNLKNVKDDMSRRFSLMKMNDGAGTKEQWPYMRPPLVTTEFPDIEYGASLIGELDLGIPRPKALLYIMGGSKYIDSKSSLENIKHFSLFNFTTQNWEDLSGTLPEDLSRIAGHQLISINDNKLIALGGYKANNYTMQPNIAAANPRINNFKNIYLYDIYQNKWEKKETKMTEQDEKVLSSRKHYSTTAVYRNLKLFVYAGYQPDLNGSNTLHYFGILDLKTWEWKWYQIGFNTGLDDMTGTSFDSILIDGNMIVSHSNNQYGNQVKFFKFDLNLGYYSNLGSLTYNLLEGNGDSTSRNFRNVPLGLTVVLIILAVIVFSIIVFLLYRFYKNSKNMGGEGIRFETEDIWSDPSIYATKKKNMSNKHLRQYRLYQCYIFQQLNSYSPLGQSFSYHEPETTSIHESNSRTHVNMHQNIYKLPDSNEGWDTYSTY